MRSALTEAAPEQPKVEAHIQSMALSPTKIVRPKLARPEDMPAEAKARSIAGGVKLTAQEGRIVLEGYAVTSALEKRLVAWLCTTA